MVPPGTGTSRPTVARASGCDRAMSRTAPMMAPAATIGSRRSLIKVVPAWLPCPVTLSRQRPWPEDGGADGDRPAEVDQPAALLDVQLDEDARSGASASSSRPRRAGSRPCRAAASAKRDPVGVAQPRRPWPGPGRRSAAGSRGRRCRIGSPPPPGTPRCRAAASGSIRRAAAGRPRPAPRRPRAGRRTRHRRVPNPGGCR